MIALPYVVLRPDLETALARATARQGGRFTEVEPIVGLHGAFADLGPLGPTVAHLRATRHPLRSVRR